MKKVMANVEKGTVYLDGDFSHGVDGSVECSGVSFLTLPDGQKIVAQNMLIKGTENPYITIKEHGNVVLIDLISVDLEFEVTADTLDIQLRNYFIDEIKLLQETGQDLYGKTFDVFNDGSYHYSKIFGQAALDLGWPET